jgi:hypothetical protein
VKAFTLSAPDNGSYMLANLPPSLRCRSCGGTSTTNGRNECSQYHDIAGATPAFLRSAPPHNELRGTDIEFGSGDEQHPLLVVGSTLAQELLAADLSGLDLHPIAD